VKLKINGIDREIKSAPDTPLLWVLRDELKLTGSKFGCGISACGACTVQADGTPIRSCVMPVQALEGKSIKTIEGLSSDRSHVLQKAWIAQQVPQCGYCQSGFLLVAEALLRVKPKPTDADIDSAITNICRCGTYPAMRAAIKQAAEMKLAEVKS
jgi:aerobic-type carbon monoxide dehydrogenase small subunit (CoxS/CutS family)